MAAATATGVKKAASKAMRTAATIVVAAPFKIAATPTALAKSEYKVLFIKRSDKLHFMGSAHVFPGGVVESEADHAPRWRAALAHATKPGADAGANHNPIRSESGEQIGFRVAALRELFEETGLLLAKPIAATAAAAAATAGTSSGLCAAHLHDLDAGSTLRPGVADSVRALIHSNANSFYDELVTTRGLVPDVSALFPLSRWVTPQGMSKRFDTWFYVALLSAPPPSDMIRADATETSAAGWYALPDMLERAKAGTISLPPPTAYTVSDLIQSSTQNGVTASTLQSLQACVMRRRLWPYTPYTIDASSAESDSKSDSPAEAAPKLVMTFPGDKDFIGLKPPDFVELYSSTENQPFTTPNGYNRALMVGKGVWRTKVTVPLQLPPTPKHNTATASPQSKL